jgi:hypothetical protein
MGVVVGGIDKDGRGVGDAPGGGLASSTVWPGQIRSVQPTSIRSGSYSGESGSRLG